MLHSDDPSISNQPLGLGDFEYEIIKTKEYPNVKNFYIFYSESNNVDTLFQLSQLFRKANCYGNCNISIYDSKDIIGLFGKYPLNDNEFIKVADRFLFMSPFDAPEQKLWYPFQDSEYEERGGKNRIKKLGK